MMNVENLKRKQVNGITLYFYAGLGWVTEERLNQPEQFLVSQLLKPSAVHLRVCVPSPFDTHSL